MQPIVLILTDTANAVALSFLGALSSQMKTCNTFMHHFLTKSYRQRFVKIVAHFNQASMQAKCSRWLIAVMFVFEHDNDFDLVSANRIG